MTEKTNETKRSHQVREHCPTCNGNQLCDIHGHVYVPWHWEDKHNCHSMSGGVDHSLLQCRGCETVFYLHDSWNDEEVEQWYGPDGETQSERIRTKVTYPKPNSTTKPVWLDAIGNSDSQLHDILNEMYVARDNESYILTVIGLRTALDRGTEVLGIDAAKTFAEKLAALQSGGWIGEAEHEVLKVIIDAGNAAAHRGWSPDAEAVGQLLIAMEVFLQRAFIVSNKTLSIKKNIPPKPTRQKVEKTT